MAGAKIPLDTPPYVASAWRSVHYGPVREAFVVEGLWGMHLYRYTADVLMDGVPMRIEPGYAGFTPPGARMDYRFETRSAHVFAHLRFPAEAVGTVELPYLFRVGSEFDTLWTRLEEIVPWRDERRASARAWDVLLALAEAAMRPEEDAPSAVVQALAFIESHLGEAISAADVAREACVSHNHLCRLFRDHLGEAPMATIRRRRVERARHLLTHTTMSVKEIARQVGIDDLQRFNKTVRLETGRAPRSLRRGSE